MNEDKVPNSKPLEAKSILETLPEALGQVTPEGPFVLTVEEVKEGADKTDKPILAARGITRLAWKHLRRSERHREPVSFWSPAAGLDTVFEDPDVVEVVTFAYMRGGEAKAVKRMSDGTTREWLGWM